MPSNQDFIDALVKQIGDPYIWGDEGPDGFDCSGLVYYGLHAAGTKVGRLTADGYYSRYGIPTSSEIRVGDLVFFNYGRLGAGHADHVGVYIGAGKMVAASSSADQVRIQSVDWSHLIGSGRVSGLSGAASVPDWVANIPATPARAPTGTGANLSGAGGGLASGELSAILQGFGMDPSQFTGLIDQAVRENWSDARFTSAVYASSAFHAAFPGIFRKDGSLKMSPGEYRTLGDEYKKIAKQYGITVDHERIGALVAGDKSPDEFKGLAVLFKAAKKSNDLGYRDKVNAVLTATGKPTIDNMQDWFGYLAGRSANYIYDLTEASRFLAAGLDINAKDALKTTAKQVGQPGEAVDLDALIGQVMAVKDFIAPELHAAGISDSDLAIIKAGTDPKGLSPLLEQILRNRQALSTVSPRPRDLATVAGRPGLYPAAQEGF